MITNKKQKCQRESFVEAAKQIGVNENDAEFKAKLRQIARADVPPEQRKKPKRKPKLSR